MTSASARFSAQGTLGCLCVVCGGGRGEGASEEEAGRQPQGSLWKGRTLQSSGWQALDHGLANFTPISLPGRPGSSARLLAVSPPPGCGRQEPALSSRPGDAATICSFGEAGGRCRLAGTLARMLFPEQTRLSGKNIHLTAGQEQGTQR